MSTQENTNVVRQAYDNFKSGNIEALLAMFTDDIEWVLPEIEGAPFSGVRRGSAGAADFFKSLADNNEVVAFEPHTYVAEGDRVVVLGSYRWRAKPTGREYGGDWAHVFTIRDGKVSHFHEYMDTAACANAFRKAATA